MELCPICIDKEADVFTECNHGYCVSCLCRIKKCAMCRNPLQRAKLCNQIKQKVELINPDTNPPIFNISNESIRRYTTIGRNGDIINRVYAQVILPELERFSENGGAPRLNFNHPIRELIWE
jgi:hypothetical protein